MRTRSNKESEVKEEGEVSFCEQQSKEISSYKHNLNQLQFASNAGVINNQLKISPHQQPSPISKAMSDILSDESPQQTNKDQTNDNTKSQNYDYQKQISEAKINECLQRLKQICPDLAVHEIIRTLAEKIGFTVTIKDVCLVQEIHLKTQNLQHQQKEKANQNQNGNNNNIYDSDDDFQIKGKVTSESREFSDSNELNLGKNEANKIEQKNQEGEMSEQKKGFIPSQRKFAQDRQFRRIQISIAKFFIKCGYDLQSYNAHNPKNLQVNSKIYHIHIVSINNNVIQDIETYIHNETDRYLTKLKNNEKPPLRAILHKIRVWLKDQELLDTYIAVMKRHYALMTAEDPPLDSQKVVKLYQVILTTLAKRPIVLLKKKTDDINFYHFRSDDLGYVFTSQETNDLQLYAIQYREIHNIQQRMNQTYNWNHNWPATEKDRRASIIGRLTNMARTKMRQIQLISNLDSLEKYDARINIKFIKEMFLARPQLSHQDQNVKKFLTSLYNFPSIKITTESANNLIKFLGRYRKQYEQIHFEAENKRKAYVKKMRQKQREKKEQLKKVKLAKEERQKAQKQRLIYFQKLQKKASKKKKNKFIPTLYQNQTNYLMAEDHEAYQQIEQEMSEVPHTDNNYYENVSKIKIYNNRLVKNPKPQSYLLNHTESINNLRQETDWRLNNISDASDSIKNIKMLKNKKKFLEQQPHIPSNILPQKNRHSISKIYNQKQEPNQSFTQEQMKQFQLFLEYQKFMNQQKKPQDQEQENLYFYDSQTQEQDPEYQRQFRQDKRFENVVNGKKQILGKKRAKRNFEQSWMPDKFPNNRQFNSRHQDEKYNGQQVNSNRLKRNLNDTIYQYNKSDENQYKNYENSDELAINPTQISSEEFSRKNLRRQLLQSNELYSNQLYQLDPKQKIKHSIKNQLQMKLTQNS